MNKVAAVTLWTGQGCLIGFINLFSMFTFRIATTPDKHAIATLTERQIAATLRACLSLQNFNNMPVRLTFQGTDIITVWIV
ncbi:hypothetical protein APT61_02235 [Leclercia adecarboxylata]|nr:hypothetical protein APT61_02235 [Leclercia adecarboxylata]